MEGIKEEIKQYHEKQSIIFIFSVNKCSSSNKSMGWSKKWIGGVGENGYYFKIKEA